MAFSLRQAGAAANATSGTTVAASLTNTPTAGDLLVVGVLFFDGTSTPPTLTVKDGNNNSYTLSATTSGATNMATAGWIAQAYLLSAPANAHKTITATFNKTIGVAAIWVDNFNPAGGTVSVDSATTFGNGNSTTINSPTIAVTSTDLLHAVACTGTAITNATGVWSGNAGGIQFGNLAEYDLSAASNTAVGFACSADVWNCLGMSFKVAAGGGVTVTPAAANTIAKSAAPSVVLGSVSVTPATTQHAIAKSVAPSVSLGSVSITPAATQHAVAKSVAPSVVLGSISVSPAATQHAIAKSAAPAVVLGSVSISPAATQHAIAKSVNPSVQAGSGVSITPAAATAIAKGTAPAVALGSISIAPAATQHSIARTAGVTLIFGSATIQPAAQHAIARSVNPTVQVGSFGESLVNVAFQKYLRIMGAGYYDGESGL